jgi:hypothetical protein
MPGSWKVLRPVVVLVKVVPTGSRTAQPFSGMWIWW